MEWRRLLIFAAVVVAAAVAVPAEPWPEDGRVSNICALKDVCKCFKNRITCTCTRDVQTLIVKTGSISEANLQTLTHFEVKDCGSLSLFESAFKPASILEMVHISNVKNVSFSSGVFQKLHTLMVDMVDSFILHKGSFEEIHGLNNIVMRKTHIPLLSEGILYNIKDLQEFKLSEVNISKIEKDAVLIDLKKAGSKAEILQSKIGIIDERGLQIGNGSTIIVQDTEIQKAEKNSIRLGANNTFIMKDNKFQSDVDIEAAKIIYNNSIEFSKNILLNVDLSNVANIAYLPENETIFTLGRLVTLHGGNYVNCKCVSPASNPSKSLKQNVCVNGCSEATVAAFLQSCQNNNAVSVEDRLKTLCKNTGDSTSTTAIPPKPPILKPTSPSPTDSSGGKISVYVLMPLVFFLFHLML